MAWFSSIFQKRTPIRRRVIGAGTLYALLDTAMRPLRGPNHAIRLSDRDYASVTRAEVEQVAAKCWEPWVRDVADCDDQALVLTVACRKAAFSETSAQSARVPWGVGFIFTAGEKAHAYTWALVQGKDNLLSVEFYDQTARVWTKPTDLDKPITLTVG